MITAKLLKKSICYKGGPVISTVAWTGPRSILAQVNTHRVFSRNARSSRAVPTAKLLEEVRTNPVIPLFTGENRPGMVAGQPLDVDTRAELEASWLCIRDFTVAQVEQALKLKPHKQDINRALEPFMWCHGIITSTEWENFYDLRGHEDAQPEILVLAQEIKTAIENGTTDVLQRGEWHLPYISQEDFERAEGNTHLLRKISAARCARISYEPFDGDASWERELIRSTKLKMEGHWSPFEHQATPDGVVAGVYLHPELHGNFYGWIQNRKLLSLAQVSVPA